MFLVLLSRSRSRFEKKKKQEPEAGAISQFFDLYWTFFQDRLEGGQ